MDEIQSDTAPDVTGSQPDSGGAPASAGSSPAEGTVIPAQPGASPEGVTAQPLAEEQPADPFAVIEKLPSQAELDEQAKAGVKDAVALAQIRPILEQAKLQSERFKPWTPIVDRFNDPTKLESQLELVTNILKDKTIEGGRSVPDTKGAVEWMDKYSPSRADSLMVDLLQSKVVYDDVEDTRLNHVFRQVVGKSVPEVVAALQELETRPAAQVIDKAELETIDPKFHDVWKTLAPETREWLMDERTTDTARNQYLQRELESVQRAESDRQAKELADKKTLEDNTRFFNEAKAEGEKAVDEGLGQILNSILDSTFKDISNDTVTLTGSKEDDVLMRLFIGGTLTSLTDPAKAPYVANDLKALGITLDPEIYQHEATYERATIAAQVALKYGDKASADARQLEADNAAMWLKAKGNELTGAMITRLSKILGLANESRATLLANANGGRQHIQGNPLNPTGGGMGNQPQFTKPLGPERTAEIVNRFAR